MRKEKDRNDKKLWMNNILGVNLWRFKKNIYS